MLKKWLGICHEQCTQCNGHATAFKMMFTYSVSIVCQEKSLHIQNNEKVLMFLMPSSQDRVQTETRTPTTSFTPPVFLIMLPLMLFFLIFDLFCTYWAVLGLFASLLAWMDPFILWPHSLTELFSEKALQLTAPFSFPPLFFWVKASSCALKFWQCCSAHGSQRESRFRCRDHDVCQQSRANLKVGSASHF